MQREYVKSSNVKSIGYDTTTSTLEVEFRTGAVYRYRGVPATVHQILMKSESVGQTFAQRVKAIYRGELLPPERPLPKSDPTPAPAADAAVPIKTGRVIQMGRVVKPR